MTEDEFIQSWQRNHSDKPVPLTNADLPFFNDLERPLRHIIHLMTAIQSPQMTISKAYVSLFGIWRAYQQHDSMHSHRERLLRSALANALGNRFFSLESSIRRKQNHLHTTTLH